MGGRMPFAPTIIRDSNTLFAANIKWNLSGNKREASRLYEVVCNQLLPI
jgi:hypothetical protein